MKTEPRGAPSLRRTTAAALESLDLRPRRRFGQSFLVDDAVASRIVDAAAVDGETVVEIGPGLGALTDSLAARAKRLISIEIDPKMAKRLETRFEGHPSVEVLAGDALEVDYAAILGAAAPALVVSNLPYSVASPILFRLYDQRACFRKLVVMLQTEVAERLVAGPGTKAYGILSVSTAFVGRASALFTVPPNAFLPRPRVESTVVSIDLEHAPAIQVDDPKWLRTVVRAGFGQRRKTLRNALAGIAVLADFERAEIDSRRRGETLSLEEFAKLANAVRARAA